MTAQELKEKLSEDDIRKLLAEMGATFYYEDDDMWITDTICHHGTKPILLQRLGEFSLLYRRWADGYYRSCHGIQRL